MFPISRDPPEGGTWKRYPVCIYSTSFPISRDPPEGGTEEVGVLDRLTVPCFQFLGIPPKGEHAVTNLIKGCRIGFPISRDPPEGGTVGN